MPQLIQVLRHEAFHMSKLATFLLHRSLSNRMMIGHPFFWYLLADIHIPEVTDRYGVLLEAYLHGCGNQRVELKKQKYLVDKLHEAAQVVKTTSHGRLRKLREALGSIEFTSSVQLPVNPCISVSGLILDKCKCIDSASLPLWLEFVNADPVGDPVYVIFKSGDDLRQDALTLQMLSIMDRLWKEDGLDLQMSMYNCVSTGERRGMVEVVPDAVTIAQIQKEASGATGALSKKPLARWLRNHNPSDEEYNRATENFLLSLAGYSVATYVLGIGDRHNDNIMICTSGHIFHIDFARFLGNVEKFQGIKRERAPFVLTPEFAHVLGGRKSEKFQRYIDICCTAFNILRKHALLFTNLFSLMLSAGIEELASPKDIDYIRRAFVLDQSDEKARETFSSLISTSLKTRATTVNFFIHNLVHLDK